MLVYQDTYKIPVWAASYLAYGDRDVLSDEDVEIADKWYSEHFPHGCLFDFKGDVNEPYFSRYPAFGERNKNALPNRGEYPFLACDVIDVDAYVDDSTIND